MVTLIPLKTPLLVLVTLSYLTLCLAVGIGIEDLTSSPLLSSTAYELESSPMGPIQTSHYTRILNQRLHDAHLPHRATPHLLPQHYLQTLIEPVSAHLNTHSKSKNLLFLSSTPDGRKVHALLHPDRAPRGLPNVAIVSTPNRWTSMSQPIQLHTFANINQLDEPGVQEGLQGEFNFHQLEALARNALPQTHDSAWRALVSRPLR